MWFPLPIHGPQGQPRQDRRRDALVEDTDQGRQGAPSQFQNDEAALIEERGQETIHDKPAPDKSGQEDQRAKARP